MALRFLNHPIIGENCVTDGPMVVRHRDAAGKVTRSMRMGKAGCLAMLRPDAEVNTRGDAAWFGVITWVQPQDEVRRGKPRLCEVWWVYTRQHLIDFVKGGTAPNKQELLAEIRKSHKRQAWVSDHFSDEPLDSIITFPSYTEVFDRVRLSRKRYLEIDIENGGFEFGEED